MKIYFILSYLLLLLHSQALTAQEVKTKEGNPEEYVYHKDSIGNVISYKEFFQLLKTGDYSSVPIMNPLTGDMEHIVKKKGENTDPRDKTFTDGNFVVSTRGAEDLKFKYSIGDTLLSVCALDINNKINCIGKEKGGNNKTLMVVVDNRSWRGIEDQLTQFISYHQSVDVMICLPLDKTSSLNDFFSNRFLKKEKNIFLAKHEDIADFPIGKNPYYYLVSETGRIELFFPPMHIQVGLLALDKFLKRDR